MGAGATGVEVVAMSLATVALLKTGHPVLCPDLLLRRRRALVMLLNVVSPALMN